MTAEVATLRSAVEFALDDISIASSEPLDRLVTLARARLDQHHDTAQRAVAYALWSFLAIEARDRHEAICTISEATEFRDKISKPLRNAVAFIDEGGSSESAVDIISDLSRCT